MQGRSHMPLPDAAKLLQTHWGTHAITKAILLLMEFALEEPLNERFVLLSESDIPLYPPAVVYLQLMSEQKSRIHACDDKFVSTSYLLCSSRTQRCIWHASDSEKLRLCTSSGRPCCFEMLVPEPETPHADMQKTSAACFWIS